MADSNLTDTTLGTDAFGESVAIAGNTIVVGDEDHNNRGYAYESDRAGLGWQLSGEQSGSNGFGITLAGSGPNLAVGTYSGRAVRVRARRTRLAHHCRFEEPRWGR